MKIPSNIEFQEDCEAVLIKSLLAVAPEEGCALLLGKKNNHKINCIEKLTYQICCIWPCHNIWEPGIKLLEDSKTFPKQPKINESKKNRFAIDPREQLFAQKWARSKQYVVLGSAHSHPSNLSIPSETDLAWNYSPSLMLIASGKGELQAWWINKSESNQGIEIPCKSKKLNA